VQPALSWLQPGMASEQKQQQQWERQQLMLNDLVVKRADTGKMSLTKHVGM